MNRRVTLADKTAVFAVLNIVLDHSEVFCCWMNDWDAWWHWNCWCCTYPYNQCVKHEFHRTDWCDLLLELDRVWLDQYADAVNARSEMLCEVESCDWGKCNDKCIMRSVLKTAISCLPSLLMWILFSHNCSINSPLKVRTRLSATYSAWHLCASRRADINQQPRDRGCHPEIGGWFLLLTVVMETVCVIPGISLSLAVEPRLTAHLRKLTAARWSGSDSHANWDWFKVLWSNT